MDALGDLNPIDSARAALQNQIGNFLQGRAKLMTLMNNPNIQVRSQAQGLYAVQVALETRLQDEITPKIQAVSSGTWSTADVLTLGVFTTQIISQIRDVGSLERQVGGVSSSILGDMDMSTVAIGIGLLVGLGVLSGMFFGKRQTSP